jgi:hypothetical protein
VSWTQQAAERRVAAVPDAIRRARLELDGLAQAHGRAVGRPSVAPEAAGNEGLA